MIQCMNIIWLTTEKKRDGDDKYNTIELVVHTKMVHIRLGINFHDAVRKFKNLLASFQKK